MIQFGPVLYALGDSEGLAQYRVLWFGNKEPVCQINGQMTIGNQLGSYRECAFWTFEFSVAQLKHDTKHQYSINDRNYEFIVPGKNAQAIRVAYTSCNGSEAETPYTPPAPERNTLWKHLKNTHQQERFHLLIQGGDQLYADSVWRDIPFLKQWQTLPKQEQYRAELPDSVYNDIKSYYMDCYLSYWSQEHIRGYLKQPERLFIFSSADV